MTKRFTASASQYYVAGAVVNAYPCTMACWFRATDVANDRALMSIGRNGSGTRRWVLFASGATAGDPITAQDRGATAQQANSSTGYSANTWHHAAAVFTSAATRSAYLDGGSKGSTSIGSSNIPSDFDRTLIGVRINTTLGAYHDGLIAFPAIWNTDLSDDEVAALGQGAPPWTIRPQSLVFAPTRIDQRSAWVDDVRGIVLASTNGPEADPNLPPQVRLPRRTARLYAFPSGVAPSFNPAWAKGSNVILGVA